MIFAIILLLLAELKMPYVFYQLLRLVVFLLTLPTILKYQSRNTKWYIHVVIAIIFNPIAPIYFERTEWQIIDLITAALLGYYWIVERKASE